jgi:hypothetical protein
MNSDSVEPLELEVTLDQVHEVFESVRITHSEPLPEIDPKAVEKTLEILANYSGKIEYLVAVSFILIAAQRFLESGINSDVISTLYEILDQLKRDHERLVLENQS